MDDRVQKLTDLKNLTTENQKLIEEMLTLAWKNRTSLEISAEVYLAKLQTENQKLTEEVLTLTKQNNAALEIQSELYNKVLEANKSKEAIYSSQSIDTRRYIHDEFEKGFRK